MAQPCTVNDRAFRIEIGEQAPECRGGRSVPGALHGRGGARGVAEEIGLTETDDLDAGPRQLRVDGTRGGKDDRAVALRLEADGAVEGDARLAARHRRVIDAEDDGQRPMVGAHGSLSQGSGSLD